MKLLQINGIKKIFRNRNVLDGINMEIEEGEISSVFGYSGEGKSTLLNIICGILKPDEGDIFLKGKKINSLEPYERKVALVMDQPLLFPGMNVLKNIGFGLKLSSNRKNSLNRDKLFNTPDEIMELLGIKGLEKRLPDEISMGQAQRVSIARALMVNPEIILMDEPFSNLDIISKTKVKKLIREINRRFKISILLVTHDIEDVVNLSDKMFILNGGKIQDSGKPKDVLKKPSSIDSAFLLGTENIIEGRVSYISREDNLIKINIINTGGHETKCHDDSSNSLNADLTIEADFQGLFEPGEPVFLAIRPEEIIILREDRTASRPVKENIMEGIISSSVFTSRMMEISIDTSEKSGRLELKALIPFHAYEVMNLYDGKRVLISLKKSSIHIIKKKKRPTEK